MFSKESNEDTIRVAEQNTSLLSLKKIFQPFAAETHDIGNGQHRATLGWHPGESDYRKKQNEGEGFFFRREETGESWPVWGIGETPKDAVADMFNRMARPEDGVKTVYKRGQDKKDAAPVKWSPVFGFIVA